MVALWLVGCGLLDLLEVQAPAPVVEAPEPEAPVELENTLEIPDAPPTMGEAIAGGGLKEAEEPKGRPPSEWSPVSMPQGQREGGGVRWEGVKRRGHPSHLRGDDRFIKDFTE